MSISVAGLLKSASDTTGGAGARFDTMFLRAVNSVGADLSTYCDLTVDEVTSTSDEIDLAAKYKRAYDFGVMFYLYQSGEWAKKPSASAQADYLRAIALCQFEAINDADPETGYPDDA